MLVLAFHHYPADRQIFVKDVKKTDKGGGCDDS